MHELFPIYIMGGSVFKIRRRNRATHRERLELTSNDTTVKTVRYKAKTPVTHGG
jgi:hypothetical protein